MKASYARAYVGKHWQGRKRRRKVAVSFHYKIITILVNRRNKNEVFYGLFVGGCVCHDSLQLI